MSSEVKVSSIVGLKAPRRKQRLRVAQTEREKHRLLPQGKTDLFFQDGLGPDRLRRVAVHSVNARQHLDHLIGLAKCGLPLYEEAGRFSHTLRSAGRSFRVDGDNLRYAAIAALGIGCVETSEQYVVLGGRTAVDQAILTAQRANTSPDLGAVALAAWAAAEVASHYAGDLFQRLRHAAMSDEGLETVVCAWALTAALAAQRLEDTVELVTIAADRLRIGQASSGLFPHVLADKPLPRYRRHVGCFADQVYPIQALARLSSNLDAQWALSAAEACARRISECQGDAGQWWWHYDIRTGKVLERYPVYSVHQHAMAPMALLELHAAGGADRIQHILRGLQWLYQRPETEAALVSDQHHVIWRKVGRREFAKIVRRGAAILTALQPNIRFVGVDLMFPPNRIDYECRPYELSWLLYAWLGQDNLRRSPLLAVKALAAPSPRSASADLKRSMFGFSFDALRIEEVVNRCREAIENGKPLLLGVMNAAKVVGARKDARLRSALQKCDLLLADGQSVVWASRLLGCSLPERVAGIDIFERLLEFAAREGKSVYLLGATTEVLQALEVQLLRRFPGLQIAGSRNGYFHEHESSQVAEAIRKTRPDLLFLGIPSPAKEIFLSTYGPALAVPVMHGVGGSFDVLAGRTKRAPVSWQRAGFEWAFRLLQEPRRLWRRYLTTNAVFIALTIGEALRGRSSGEASSDASVVSSRDETVVSHLTAKPMDLHHG